MKSRHFALAFVLLINTPALAAPPSVYTLRLTPPQVDTIGTALGNLPYRDAAPLIGALQLQINEQNKAAEAATPKIEEPKAGEPEKKAE
jgi:hypothetical protein